jgi:hypothetical protein
LYEPLLPLAVVVGALTRIIDQDHRARIVVE